MDDFRFSPWSNNAPASNAQSKPFKSFFSFFKGTDNLGVGTGSLAPRRSQTIPAENVYLGGTGPRQWNIQRSLMPISGPGFMMLNKRLVPVTLRGAGLGIAGQYVLQGLSQESAGET